MLSFRISRINEIKRES